MSTTPIAWRVRKCTREDADLRAVTEIYNASIAAGGATMDQEPKTLAYFDALLAGFQPNELLLVVESESTGVVGWGALKRYSERSGYRFTAEASVYLNRRFVRQGLGTQIKSELVARARTLGYHHLVGKLLASNTASIAYCLAYGYEVVGRQREVGWVDGRWEDVMILQLILK